MSSQQKTKQPLYKNTLFKVISFTLVAWVVIYVVWAKYPQRLMQDDMVDSNQWNQKSWVQNEWKGVPFKIPDPSELKGSSQYNSMGEKYGTYGDMYGSLNTLFSGLAFATLIISLILQMLELNATRKELAEQKDALIGQQAEFQKQTDIQNKQMQIASKQQNFSEKQSTIITNQLKETKIQNFNNLFNALLKERNSKIQQMVVYSSTPQIPNTIGITVFVSYTERLLSMLKNGEKTVSFDEFIKNLDNPSNLTDPRQIIYNDWNMYEAHGSRNYAIGNYFGIIFRMYELIDQNKDILNESVRFYKDIILSLMTLHEYIVLFWYCSTNEEYDKIIYKFKIFEKLPHTDGLTVIAKKLYRIDAFNDNRIWINAYKDND